MAWRAVRHDDRLRPCRHGHAGGGVGRRAVCGSRASSFYFTAGLDDLDAVSQASANCCSTANASAPVQTRVPARLPQDMCPPESPLRMLQPSGAPDATCRQSPGQEPVCLAPPSEAPSPTSRPFQSIPQDKPQDTRHTPGRAIRQRESRDPQAVSLPYGRPACS